MRSIIALLAACSIPMAAYGQSSQPCIGAISCEPTFDVQLFYPAPGSNNFFSVESADVNQNLALNVGIDFNFAHRPLAIQKYKLTGELDPIGSMVLFRFDGALNFASASFFEEQVMNLLAQAENPRHVLIVGHGINEIDATGEEMLDKGLDHLRQQGLKVSFSGLKEPVVDVLRRTHLLEKLGEENVYPTQLIALAEIYDDAHLGSTEELCPLLKEHAPAYLPVVESP